MKYADIEKTFKNKQDILMKEYYKRQQASKTINENKAREITTDFSFDSLPIPKELDSTNKISYLITLLINSNNPNHIKLLFDILNKHGYNVNCELLKTMIKTDYLFNEEIDFNEYELLVKGLSITNPDKQNDVTLSINTMYGRTNLQKISSIDPDDRRGFCHDVTSDVLRCNPNLYGAYYYIPREFKGTLEHSVVIDSDKKLVYDYANNIAVPLSIWVKYYGNPSILIKGDTFIELDKKCQNNLGFYLTTWHLEETKRTRRK